MAEHYNIGEMHGVSPDVAAGFPCRESGFRRAAAKEIGLLPEQAYVRSHSRRSRP
jgi:hypothetical protein